MAKPNRERTPDEQGSENPVLYDEENDILYVTLSENRIERTVALDDLRLVDYDAKGSPVGIEFVAASEGVDLPSIPLSARVQTLLADSKMKFPIVSR